MRLLFVSDTHIGVDWPTRPRVARRRRGDDFFQNFERALEPARTGEVDVVVHGGDLLYRSRVPAWLAETALAPLKRLASSGVPVLLVPGNHERGRIPCPLLAVHEGLHVFDRPRSVVLDAGGVRVAFIGFPYTHDIRRRFPQILAAASREQTMADVRVLCLHHCVEGATCGPGNFTFRFGADVIRTADLPNDVAVTLSGHIHRHQVLRLPGRPPVIYAGSVERTSFAEALETKGFVVVELTQSGLGSFEFRPLPARPMVARTVHFDDADPIEAHARMAAAIDSAPYDAVVHLRVTGAIPTTLTAAALRAMAGVRTVTLAFPSNSPGPFTDSTTRCSRSFAAPLFSDPYEEAWLQTVSIAPCYTSLAEDPSSPGSLPARLFSPLLSTAGRLRHFARHIVTRLRYAWLHAKRDARRDAR